MDKYILDACALLSLVRFEPGYEVVDELIQKAIENKIYLYITKLNLLEVYYDLLRSEGLDIAETMYSGVSDVSIKIIDGIPDNIFRKAGQIKAHYKLSLADSILLSTAISLNASIVTADHHELDTIEKKENIKITWFR